MRVRFLLLCLLATLAWSATPASCPAGVSIGTLPLEALPRQVGTPLSLRAVNRLQPGDRVRYTPPERAQDNRKARVALVLAPAVSEPKAAVTVLDAKPAHQPAEWTIPIRTGVIAVVYGPQGLDLGKVKSAVKKDQELVSQLADYAQTTATTEALVQALARFDQQPDRTQDLGRAMVDFASRYGATARINPNAPMDQQALVMLRTLNPALSGVDPFAPDARVRLQQTAGLAASVAGLFFGSTVGIAAGGAALLANMHQMIFPGTDLRSALAQQGDARVLSLCAPREQHRSRTRVAYLWATRLPDAEPPSVTVVEASVLPLGTAGQLGVRVPDEQWARLSRVQSWSLVGPGGVRSPVPIRPNPQGRSLAIDLSATSLPAGSYRLAGRWDWQEFEAAGQVTLQPLGDLARAQLTPHSQADLRQGNGKVSLTLAGTDLRFVTSVALRQDDKPLPLRFTPSATGLTVELDTAGLPAGTHTLLIAQADGAPREVPVRVLPPHPSLGPLPLAVHVGELSQLLSLTGTGLERVRALEADGLTFTLGEPASNARAVEAHWQAERRVGERLDLRLSVEGVPEPVIVPAALLVARAKPRVTDVQVSLPERTGVELRSGEVPADAAVSFALRVENLAGASPVLTLRCDEPGATLRPLRLQAGEQQGTARARLTGPDSLFLSLVPGEVGQSGCTLTVTVEAEGRSKAAPLGKVVRVPRVAEFELTDEKLPDGRYVGTLRGQDLETIEKVGWTATEGSAPEGLPTPVSGTADTHVLRLGLPWPAPAPRAPLFIWLRGEAEGRLLKVRW